MLDDPNGWQIFFRQDIGFMGTQVFITYKNSDNNRFLMHFNEEGQAMETLIEPGVATVIPTFTISRDVRGFMRALERALREFDGYKPDQELAVEAANTELRGRITDLKLVASHNHDVIMQLLKITGRDRRSK